MTYSKINLNNLYSIRFNLYYKIMIDKKNNTWLENTGNRNTGDRNTWYSNTGYRNTGNRNTGNRNTWNRNTGYCNTISPTKWLLFNKECQLWDSDWNIIVNIPSYFYFDVETTEWISWDNMSETEKENNSFAESLWWYLKVFETDKSLQMNWKKSFNESDVDDVKKTLELPNFDYNVFEEITGITKEMFDKKLWIVEETNTVSDILVWKEVKVTIDWVEYTAVIKQSTL